MNISKIRLKKRKQSRATKKALDRISPVTTISENKERGRPRQTPWEWIANRASNFESQLSYVWYGLKAPLLEAKTEDEVTNAFKTFADFCSATFVPGFSADILALLRDKNFPQRPEPQIKFIARSLAGRSSIEKLSKSFRSSRDICEKVAAQLKGKSPHKILRREYYIECSCGYRGPALDNACRKCGAQPQLSIHEWTGKAPKDVPVHPKIKVRQSPQNEVAQIISQTNILDYSHVLCECGATIAAATRELALNALAEHKRTVHADAPDERADKPE